MDLADEVERVVTREDLAEFIDRMAVEAASPRDWENATLPRFLEAMGAWLPAMAGAHRRDGLEAPEPSWNLIAQMLHAATLYE
jgi:hypothetical protein